MWSRRYPPFFDQHRNGIDCEGRQSLRSQALHHPGALRSNILGRSRLGLLLLATAGVADIVGADALVVDV